jgi:hypothetical protein
MKKLDPRSVIIGFLVAVIGFMSLGAVNTTFDSITVGEIILKDENLLIKDMWQDDILMIAGDEFVHGVFVYNKKGDQIAVIGESDSGGGVLDITNSAGQNTIELTQTVDGGAIKLFNSTGQNTINLTQNSYKNGIVSINSNTGQNSIVVGVSKNGTGLFQMFNKHEKGVVFIGSTNEADGHITLSDRYGEAQWQASGKR